MIANVPAGCDTTANEAGRAFGFPYWGNYAKARKDPKILQTGRYFDAVNFAENITCPALVSMGLIDETCPPAGVLSACNVMKGKVELLILPKSDHQGRGNTQAAFWKRSEEWLRALAKGEPAPGK
jgi:cephalosporin-C deacetylase-like acetyl esterase